jgi:hypothetical protein
MFQPRARVTVSLILLVAAGVGSAGLDLRANQSLADVARKEEDRRKTVPAPAKVYTNKDLTPTTAGSTPAPATPADSTTTTKAETDAKDAKEAAAKLAKANGPAKDQAYWAGRLKALKDKLERDTTFADALQTKINSLTADFVNRDDPAQRATLERDRQKSIGQLAALRKDVETGKKAIVDLEEEARRAGVPPGWLR